MPQGLKLMKLSGGNTWADISQHVDASNEPAMPTSAGGLIAPVKVDWV